MMSLLVTLSTTSRTLAIFSCMIFFSLSFGAIFLEIWSKETRKDTSKCQERYIRNRLWEGSVKLWVSDVKHQSPRLVGTRCGRVAARVALRRAFRRAITYIMGSVLGTGQMDILSIYTSTDWQDHENDNKWKKKWESRRKRPKREGRRATRKTHVVLQWCVPAAKASTVTLVAACALLGLKFYLHSSFLFVLWFFCRFLDIFSPFEWFLLSFKVLKAYFFVIERYPLAALYIEFLIYFYFRVKCRRFPASLLMRLSLRSLRDPRKSHASSVRLSSSRSVSRTTTHRRTSVSADPSGSYDLWKQGVGTFKA